MVLVIGMVIGMFMFAHKEKVMEIVMKIVDKFKHKSL